MRPSQFDARFTMKQLGQATAAFSLWLAAFTFLSCELMLNFDVIPRSTSSVAVACVVAILGAVFLPLYMRSLEGASQARHDARVGFNLLFSFVPSLLVMAWVMARYLIRTSESTCDGGTCVAWLVVGAMVALPIGLAIYLVSFFTLYAALNLELRKGPGEA